MLSWLARVSLATRRLALAATAILAFALVPPARGATATAKKSTTHHSTPSATSASPSEAPLAPGDTLLARVGKRNITTAGFRDEWAQLQPNEKPVVPDQVLGYKMFLDDLVARDLLAQEAERVGEKLTPAQERDVQTFANARIRNELFVEDVVNKVEIDTTQVDRYRTQLSRILFLTAFVFPTRDGAQAWYTRIVSGTPVSRIEAAAKQGGEGAPRMIVLGNKIREDFDAQSAGILFGLAPGRLSAPVKVAEGWALFELVSWRQRPNGIAAGSREGVLREMRRIAANSYKEVFRDSLAKAVHIVYHQAAMDTILNRFLVIRDRTVPLAGGGAQYNMFQPMPVFQPGDSALVLATSSLGEVKGGDLYRFLAAMSDIERPEIRSDDQLRPWVDRVAFDQVLLESAIAKGYDKNPQVVHEVGLRREKYLVESLYADSVSAGVRISLKEARDYYASDTTKWMEHENLKMWVLAATSKALAESLLIAGQKGANLKEMAYQFTQLGDYAENGGMTQAFIREQCPTPSATDSIFKTPVGSFGGPIASIEGWVIFKVLEHRPDRIRPFEEAEKDVVQTMRNEQEEAAMQLFLGRLRKRYGVETHEEVLAAMAGKPGLPAPR